MTESLISLLTALGDDELVIGHRHSEWTGFAPHIEEDVAFSSIAQDEIGHAAAYFAIAAKETGDDPDRIALGREKDGYRNAILCERLNREWGYTLARQWLYDTADAIRLEALAETSHAELRGLVEKMRREERYHLLHADMWIKRVAQGPVEGRRKLIEATTEAFDDSMGLFEPVEDEEGAVKEGYLPVPSDELRRRYVDRVSSTLDELGFPMHIPERAVEGAEFVASSSGDLIAGREGDGVQAPHHDALGGRKGRRSPDFDGLWEDMTGTYQANPGARW
jgi:ring-1,2-phenylacetyl-CoA epoxidase subunit PaaC